QEELSSDSDMAQASQVSDMAQVSDTEQASDTEQLSDTEQVSNTEQASAKRSHSRKDPDQNWFRIYPWLKKEVIENKIVLLCTLCKERNGKIIFAVGTTRYRLENIKNHIKTTEHKESEEFSKPQQTRIITNFAKQLGIEKLNIISLMRNVYFCAKNHQPINLFPNLCELVTTQIRNHKEYITSDKMCVLKTPQYEKNKTKASYGSYTNNNSGNGFLDSICNVIEESLFKELNASKYWMILFLPRW
ncbi:23965_t:CDS:2, partial [Gigaspora margarita]